MNNNKLYNHIQSYLCPPGSGVHTVNTAKEKKEIFLKQKYGSLENIDQVWRNSLPQIESSEILLLGICSDAGGGIQRGANWGPLFIRNHLLENYKNLKYFDCGDVKVNPHLLHDKYLNETTLKQIKKSFYKDENSTLPVSPLSITEDFCQSIYLAFPQKKIFSLGGDHSVSYPLVKAFLENKNKQKKKIGLVHFDAHTDLLDERLGIDYCFGSWTYHILPFMPDTKDVVQIGIRSTGKPKSFWESELNVTQYWAKEVKSQGADSVAKKIINQYKKNKIDELYVSFDIDALDESFASATGTPEADGLAPDECIYILRELKKIFPITGADLVEVAPNIIMNQENIEPDTTLLSSGIICNFLLESMNSDGN